MKWFERKFEPLNPHLSLTGILERLYGTPLRLRYLVTQIPDHLLTKRIDQTWSIQENAGHLLDLEPLWAGRVDDFIAGAETLRPADLSNQKTHEASHNAGSIQNILEDFEAQRASLIGKFVQLNDRQLGTTALHPRLGTPMLPVDLAYFVAEHDDHHLARIRAIWRTLAG